MNSPAFKQRLDYLDGVRAFALLLGIIFHASMSYMPFYIGWAVMDISTSSIVSVFVLVSHSFRMELFFLIAGFFSHMTFHSKGSSTFIKSRLTRIAIPFVIGWIILRPLIVSSWVMGSESLRGDVNVLNGLTDGLQSLENISQDFLTGTHLWFLYYLLLATAITLILRLISRSIPIFHTRAQKWADHTITWIANSRFSILVLSLPTAACIWNMNGWGMDTPDKSLVPQLPVILLYSGFFCLGWLMKRQDKVLATFTRLTLGRFILCAVSIGLTIKLANYQANMAHPHIEQIRAGFTLCYAVMMWSLVVLSIALFRRFFDQPNKIVRYFADASYWIYLIHLPIVVWLQVAFAELPLHWSIKLTAVSLLTVGISLFLYDLCVRSTIIGKVINGRRKNRELISPKFVQKTPTRIYKSDPTTAFQQTTHNVITLLRHK